jgi:hypothetical protein
VITTRIARSRLCRIVLAAVSIQLLLGLSSVSPAAAAPATPRVQPRAAVRGLPTTRLELGLSSAPDQLAWMRSSGVPWKYRYQYLTGGVNTSDLWTTWQIPSAPPGQFAADYMTASGAAGYIPYLVYYVLLKSAPGSGKDEGDRDYNNLNNTSTMNAYFANFKLLMQLAGAYRKPVVVNIEPDLWGFLQVKAQAKGSNSAAALSAAVASSGFPDVAAYPNTVAGFGRALLHLRDKYAPNVVTQVNASAWSSGFDIDTSTAPNLDVTALADQTATFLSSTGKWDTISTDPDDHDAGWWETTGHINQDFTHWWDTSNVKFPNFHRWESWIGQIHTRMRLPVFSWQTPAGTMGLSDACNQGTGDGHYRDNVAQYFLTHPAELSKAGLVGVLFGAGNPCQTTPYNDGNALRNLAQAYYAGHK